MVVVEPAGAVVLVVVGHRSKWQNDVTIVILSATKNLILVMS